MAQIDEKDKKALFKINVLVWIVMFLLSFSVFYLLIGDWQFVLGLMLMIGVHEYGHLLAAKFVGGVETGGFYFLPIGGISLIKGWPLERWKRYVIAMGGPAIGIVLCFLGLFFYKTYNIASLNLIISTWILINIFNLIPMYPLDGGRVVFQIAASMLNEKTAQKFILYATWICSILFFLVSKSIVFVIIVFLLRRHWGRPELEKDHVGKPIEGALSKILAILGYLVIFQIYNFMATLL